MKPDSTSQAADKFNTQIRIARRMRQIWREKLPADYGRRLKLEIDLNNVGQLNWAFEHAFGSDMDSWSRHVDQLAEDWDKAKREASAEISDGMATASKQSGDGRTDSAATPTAAATTSPAATPAGAPTSTPASKPKWKLVRSHGGLLATRVKIPEDDDTDNQSR